MSVAPLRHSEQLIHDQLLHHPTVLVIDDEPLNLDTMREMLEDRGYNVLHAEHGAAGLVCLRSNPNVSVIAVDRNMPQMDGMAFVQAVKADKKLCDIPIIMQTAASASKDIREGIEAGVFYYLTKPYNGQLFLSVIESALDEYVIKDTIRKKLKRHSDLFGLMDSAHFTFRTLEDASTIAFTLGLALPNSQKAIYGLNELLVNAIEHGNCAFNYMQKKELQLEGEWLNTINKRLAEPDQQERFARLDFTTREDGFYITISDSGDGFDWKPYMHVNPNRMTGPNGRGIHVARHIAFDDMYYNEQGNCVTCIIYRDSS